jgi:hypothetical protein
MHISNLVAAISAAALLAGPVSAQEAVRANVLAPHTLTKTTAPESLKVDFGLKPLIHGPYRLELHSTDVTDVKVILNGVEHFDFRDFAAEHHQSKTVLLEELNTLHVELKGHHNESLTFSIVGHQYALAASYSGLDLFPGASGSGDIDWRPKGAVTGVQNQGQCGSDWAFSTTGAVEGAVQRKTGALVNLSEQQLIDCAHSATLFGCSGGSPASAMRYLMSYGAVADASYLYTARDGSCKAAPVAARVIGVLRSPPGDDTFLMQLLRSKGPVSVVVNANWLEEYGRQTATNKKLIENGRKCETETPSYEAMLLIGTATDNGKPYWILKPARGASFGIQGYVYLARGQNTCGIADYAIVPLN